MGYVTDRIGRYRVIEGIGRHGGFWFAKGPDECVRFNSRVDAVEHCHLSNDERQ